jgi:RNA polymerase sigma factor (TIGR02999 family)
MGADAHTLSPTALVHEAYLKLHRAQERGTLQSLEQHQFFPAAARAMRQILIDHARKRRARLDAEASSEQIRHTKPDFEEGTRIVDLGPTRAADILDLDAAITGLEAFDPEAARLVQLRFFAGLSVEQAAEVMGVGRTTAEGWWRLSRALLTRKLCE